MKKIGLSPPTPVLLVFHEQCSDGGDLKIFLKKENHPILDVRPRFGGVLPHAASISSVVFFGGSSSANDNESWLKYEMKWMEEVLKQNKPILGICLGSQMLAKILGAEVKKIYQDKMECGYYPLKGQGNLKEIKYVYHWHAEEFDLPQGAISLAQGSAFSPNQAFEYQSATGVQFHPEVTPSTIERWSKKSPDDLKRSGARPFKTHLEEYKKFHPPMQKWLESFIQSTLIISHE